MRILLHSWAFLVCSALYAPSKLGSRFGDSSMILHLMPKYAITWATISARLKRLKIRTLTSKATILGHCQWIASVRNVLVNKFCFKGYIGPSYYPVLECYQKMTNVSLTERCLSITSIPPNEQLKISWKMPTVVMDLLDLLPFWTTLLEY
jgi:hypothetical protein